METEINPVNPVNPVKKGGRPCNKTTETVRAYASQAGTFTRAAARRDLGLERQAVDTAIDTLIRGKRLKRTGKASFEWITEKTSARQAPLEQRIWHAMRINPTWSATDIAIQAGTTVSYVYKRLQVYRAAGHIENAGVKHLGLKNCCLKYWRLTSAARANLDVPRVVKYSPDPLVVAAVKLNRLICTGLARFVDERREAARLCRTILSGLEAGHGKSSEVQ